MHNHKHDHCQHELKYCEKCDVVYCVKCNREWGQSSWVYPYTYTYPYPTPTWTVSSGSVTITDTETLKCNHTG